MPTPANPNLLSVDWSRIPAPIDDGAARHLEGVNLPDIALPATDGSRVSPPRPPAGVVVPPDPGRGARARPWLGGEGDMPPGGGGCTPQGCPSRDPLGGLRGGGPTGVFGFPPQNPTYQPGAPKRLPLP